MSRVEPVLGIESREGGLVRMSNSDRQEPGKTETEVGQTFIEGHERPYPRLFSQSINPRGKRIGHSYMSLPRASRYRLHKCSAARWFLA